MKLLVAIPSKGRAKSIFKRTLRWVVRTGFDVRVFVEPGEIEEYRKWAVDANYQNYLDIRPDQFIDIGKDNGGLSHVRGVIKRFAIDNGYDLVFRMDDDVMRFTGRGKNKDDGEMILLFAAMVGACRRAFARYVDLAAVGFPYRNELFEEQQWTAINARLQTCYIIKPEFMVEGFDNFDDFADYVNIRKQNKVTLRYGLLGIDTADVGREKGGLQSFDRAALAKQDMEKLRELHPALKFKKVEGKAWEAEPILTGEFFGVKKL